MRAIGANRVSDHKADQMADLIELAHATAKRAAELAEQVATLKEQVEDLETRA